MRINNGNRPTDESGNALVAVLVAAVSVGGLLYASLSTTTIDLRNSSRSIDDLRTMALAQAGIEQALDRLRSAGLKYNTINPLQGIRSLFTAGSYVPFVATPLVVGGQNFGEFTVTVTAVTDTPEAMDLTIEATGYYPVAPVHLAPGIPAPRHKSLRVSVRAGLEKSKVFDYGYFINNWGWFYGSNMFCNGNARSNGQFDVAGHAPTVTGQPTYDTLQWTGGVATLSGYRDDNEDGLADGNDGGIFAGWDITGVGNVVGNGGLTANQHDFVDPVEMPNLSDLTPYEQRAIATAGRVSVSGTTLFTGVYGDESGEKQNLYLVGTPTDPIRIDGTVVVRGSVVLAGVVTGQGAVYAGGNVYVPNDLTYANPPTTSRPSGNSQTATEAWLTTNHDKDFVAVLARENIVVGDHTDSSWRSNVDAWLSHAMNQSKEDAGEDGIPNTSLGKDGIADTEDDDVLEGDDVFTVDVYTTEDEALGLIPPGRSVGSAIPGSGEDIDGDGAFDPTLTVADLDPPAALDTYDWGGTISSPISWSSIASTAMTRLDGVFYTNHAFAWMTTPTQPIHMNGALVTRNESIIYGGPSLNFNYDCRLLGGSTSVIGDMLPRTLSGLELRGWMVLDEDPNSAISL